MPTMTKPERLDKMYVNNDTLSTRIGLHDKYSVNKYGWGNWVFDRYTFAENINVLELGCGTADIWRDRENGLPAKANIILSDFSPLMVQKAKDLLHGNSIFSFQQINIQDIPYGSDTFDIVIANHMLYHVPDKEKALAEVKRVLKTGGRFYTSTIGEKSLAELNEIYEKFDDKASFSYTKNISFTLENGLELLSKYFIEIEQQRYIDSLEVTNANDIIAYIKSYNEVPDSIISELRALVNEGFIDGVFKIQKEQGIFICTKQENKNA